MCFIDPKIQSCNSTVKVNHFLVIACIVVIVVVVVVVIVVVGLIGNRPSREMMISALLTSLPLFHTVF